MENNCKIIASGEQEKKYGILHTWYVDYPSSQLSGQKAGVHYELIATDDLSDLSIDDDELMEQLDFIGEVYELVEMQETWMRLW